MNYTFSNPSPSSSEMSICQICSWRRLQSFWESLLSSSSGSSECLLTKVRQFKKHLWKELLIAGLALKIKSKVTIKYSSQYVFISLWIISLWSDRTVLQLKLLKYGIVKILQEPERSCLISSFSGMSWMATLIFSLISLTAFCHFKLQWRRSKSQSADTK